MQWVETTARSVREAVELALDQLGVVEDDAEWEVLEEPRGGLRGLFGGSARVRARVKPVSREKPRTRTRRERDPARPGAKRGGEGHGRRDRGADRGGEKDKAGAEKQRGGGGSRPARGAVAGRGQERRGSEEVRNVVAGEIEPAIPLIEQVETARQFVEGLVNRMGVTAEVVARAEGDDDIYVDVNGEDLGVLIGHRAATLGAMEELARTAVQHRAVGGSAYVHVDVQGYRERRRQALVDFALEVARRAVETGEDQAFEPMPAADRKIVHDAVQGVEGVTTTSEGVEPRRRVVIVRA